MSLNETSTLLNCNVSHATPFLLLYYMAGQPEPIGITRIITLHATDADAVNVFRLRVKSEPTLMAILYNAKTGEQRQLCSRFNSQFFQARALSDADLTQRYWVFSSPDPHFKRPGFESFIGGFPSIIDAFEQLEKAAVGSVLDRASNLLLQKNAQNTMTASTVDTQRHNA